METEPSSHGKEVYPKWLCSQMGGESRSYKEERILNRYYRDSQNPHKFDIYREDDESLTVRVFPSFRWTLHFDLRGGSWMRLEHTNTLRFGITSTLTFGGGKYVRRPWERPGVAIVSLLTPRIMGFLKTKNPNPPVLDFRSHGDQDSQILVHNSPGFVNPGDLH